MAEDPIITPQGDPGPEKTFTQAEVDKIVGRRIASAMRGMPTSDELTEFNAWKAHKGEDAQALATVTQERDTANSALAAANEKITAYEREKSLLKRGIAAEDVDYYAFKIGKMVTDKLDFEAAAEQFFKDHKPAGTVRVDPAGALNNGSVSEGGANAAMNAIFRNFRK